MLRLWTRLHAIVMLALLRVQDLVSGVRINVQSLVFFVACGLLYSGFSDISPRAGKIALGLVLLHAVHRQQQKAGQPAKKTP